MVQCRQMSEYIFTLLKAKPHCLSSSNVDIVHVIQASHVQALIRVDKQFKRDIYENESRWARKSALLFRARQQGCELGSKFIDTNCATQYILAICEPHSWKSTLLNYLN